MMRVPSGFGFAAGFALLGMVQAPAHAAPQTAARHTPARASAIDWRTDVDAAFREATARRRPVLLFWGGRWCPPCNRLLSGLYKDPAFIAASRKFVALHVDGDDPGAQAWGETFGIYGYPTLLVLDPAQKEIARIATGLPAAQIVAALETAEGVRDGADARFERVRTRAPLTAGDWQLLTIHDWDNDPRRFGDPAAAPAILDLLTVQAPDPAMRRYFKLLHLSKTVETDDDDHPRFTAAQREAFVATVSGILPNWSEVLANRETLAAFAGSGIQALPAGRQRETLLADYIRVFGRLHDDSTLPLLDRVEAGIAVVRASPRDAGGQLAAPLVMRARGWAQAADMAATSPELRQSTMSTTAQLLDEIGDPRARDQVLEKEVGRSPWPFYFMTYLANFAEQRGDATAALGWARRASAAAIGPASRLQWAVTYATVAMRVAPADTATVQHANDAVTDALRLSRDGLHQRTRENARRWHRTLAAWSAKQDGDTSLRRVDVTLGSVCAGLNGGDARSSCRTAFGLDGGPSAVAKPS